MQNIKRRLTFANVVALLALFISLGGSVYAASKINGKQIKKTSIAGKKLKPDTLTGTQINESTLGSVPNAEHASSADTATTAGSAQTAGDAQTLAGSGPDGVRLLGRHQADSLRRDDAKQHTDAADPARTRPAEADGVVRLWRGVRDGLDHCRGRRVGRRLRGL